MEIQYDPSETNYSALLDMFWKYHDSTAVNKTQYMSAIFYHDEEQLSLAQSSLILMQKNTSKKIQTKILPAERFYDAENYHQKYLLRRHTKIFQSLNLTDSQVIHSSVAARLTGYLNGYGSVSKLTEECHKWGLNEDLVKTIIKVVESASMNGGCEGGVCKK
ncbi:peptide methionine sulfoxide reductase isoform X1 [Hydra vulgaris]|uniref:peptide methionine sulfoxide reductase isoform X1 n=1 Tax=Hydra vulgaris TaxID=6087 RepID=UPI001F5ECB40|nr:peptide methionine sulfoxide reductase [Hydra vulgaris]